MPFYLYRSKLKGKKYMLKAHDKEIHFGAKGMRDFTLVNDPKSHFYLPDENDRETVKRLYRSRHRNDPHNVPFTPASLSWHLLWSKPTLDKSIKSYSRKIGVEIINRT